MRDLILLPIAAFVIGLFSGLALAYHHNFQVMEEITRPLAK